MMRGRHGSALAAASILLAGPAVAAAHGGADPPLGGALRNWNWDGPLLAALSLSGFVYARGLRKLWQHAGPGRGVRPVRALCFAAGLLLLACALMSPLDRASDILFSAHMAQHELLTLVVPPLLVLGRPNITASWALPRKLRGPALALSRTRAVVTGFRAITAPAVTLLVHGLVLWAWHAPVLFEAALHSETVHAVQHASFLFTALLFWWSLLAGRYGRAGYGAGVLLVFVTAIHSGSLGALLTVASTLWYPTHAARTASAGVDAFADQQLAGLLMWIPGGVLLALIALALFAAWLGEMERRAARRPL